MNENKSRRAHYSGDNSRSSRLRAYWNAFSLGAKEFIDSPVGQALCLLGLFILAAVSFALCVVANGGK